MGLTRSRKTVLPLVVCLEKFVVLALAWICLVSAQTTHATPAANLTKDGFHVITNRNIHHAVREYVTDKDAAKLKYGPISHWATDHVHDMSYLFSKQRIKELEYFNPNITLWNVGKVKNMTHIFAGNVVADPDFSHWNVSKVVDMSGSFAHTEKLTGHGLGHWDVSSVQNMSSMFRKATAFHKDGIHKWNTRSVRAMANMFEGATNFEGNVRFKWRTGQVHTFEKMFAHAEKFVGDVSDFNTHRVTNMHRMFLEAKAFNGVLSKWNTTNLRDMNSIFTFATSYQGVGLESWDVSKVTDMEDAFRRAEHFNVDLSHWDVSKVRSFRNMFKYAKSFAQKICWTLNSQAKVDGMFLHSRGYFSEQCVHKEVIGNSCCNQKIDPNCGCSAEGESSGHDETEVVNAPAASTSAGGVEGQAGDLNVTLPSESLFTDSAQYGLAVGLAAFVLVAAGFVFLVRGRRKQLAVTRTNANQRFDNYSDSDPKGGSRANDNLDDMDIELRASNSGQFA